jgi:uncharacterized protein YprB with RNaseH-like and TPR domain/ribosomal protein S27AE
MMTKKHRIIFIDVETAPMVVTSWGLYPKALSHENIMQDWFMICAAWKYNDEKKVHAVSIGKKIGDDYDVVKNLRNAIAQADIVVGHNSDRFDIKKLNARIIFHGLEPLPMVSSIDTLKEVRKIAAFTSNRLDYLAKVLVGEGKLKTDYHLWLKAMQGNKKAIADMVTYNKVDVIRLEEVYLRLRPYMKSHIHVGALNDKDRHESCPKCGSSHFKLNGVRVTASGVKRQECQCSKCGGYFRIPMVKI